MNERINLLDTNKKSAPAAFLRRLQTTRSIVVGLLFIVAVSSVILFILVALSPLPALQSKEQSLRQQLAQSKTDMAKLAIINERTTAIKRILAKRQTLDQILGLIQSKLSADTTITGIKEEKGALTVTVESSSLQSLDNFLNGLISFVQAKKAFSQAELTELTVDPATNAYLISVRLVILTI